MQILKNYNLNYTDFINMFDAKIVTHEDLALKKYNPDESRLITIRHDVDLSIEAALKLAKYEKENNIISTYFLLHTARYFDYSRNFKKQCQKIRDCGHHIGIHNNAVVMHRVTNQDPFDILMKPLKFLREKCKISVVGSAPHGDKVMCRRHNLMGLHNKILWSQYKFKPSDFGLSYHALQFYREGFVGDGGCVLKGWCWPPKTEKVTKYKDLKSLKKNIIDKFNKLDNGLMILLLHPRWWK